MTEEESQRLRGPLTKDRRVAIRPNVADRNYPIIELWVFPTDPDMRNGEGWQRVGTVCPETDGTALLALTRIRKYGAPDRNTAVLNAAIMALETNAL